MTQNDTDSEGRFGSTDVLSDTKAALGPIQPTVTDALGVERIVGPGIDAWTPAPVDPDPEAVAHREFVDGLIAERKQERLDAFLTADPEGAATAQKANGVETKSAAKAKDKA